MEIDGTLDNFLFWIVEENPDEYAIEKQVYQSLCASNTLFNHLIDQKKRRKKAEEAARAWREDHEKLCNAMRGNISAYCTMKGLIPYFTHSDVYLFKVYNTKVYDAFMTANDDTMEVYIKFIQEHPDNADACIVKCGTLEEIEKYISQGGKKHVANI